MYHPKHIHTWPQLDKTTCLDIRRGLLGMFSKFCWCFQIQLLPGMLREGEQCLQLSAVGDSRVSSKRLCPITPIITCLNTLCAP